MLWPEVENRPRPWAVAYNGRKGAQLVVREAKEVRLRLFRHANHRRFVMPSGGLRRFGLIETPDLVFYGFAIPVSKVHNRPAGENGRSYRGQSNNLVAATLFFHKINCGFRYAFQFCTFFYLPAPLGVVAIGRGF